MTKILEKEGEKFDSSPVKDDGTSVADKLELMKYASSVQSRIKNEISSDFLLAKLSEKDREAIIEMTSNAYFVKKVIDNIAYKMRGYVWKNGTWYSGKCGDMSKGLIRKYAEKAFDAYMIRLYMTTIVNRNVDKNNLLKLIAGFSDDPEEDDMQDDKRVMDKVKGLFKNEPEKQQ